MSKYFAIFSLSFMRTLKNGKALAGLSLLLITCIVIFLHLWKLASPIGGNLSLTYPQLIWYLAMNEWMFFSLPDIYEEIEIDLRTGRLAYVLPRPISYVCSMFADALGILCANLIVLGVVAFSFTWFQVGTIPFDIALFPIMLFYGLASGIVATLFLMAVGLTAFWVHEVSPFFWIWEKFLFLLGGLIMPLALYPDWLASLARLTPFPTILGDRSFLVIDGSWENITSLSIALLAWGTIGWLCVAALYKRGLRILNIEGG